MLKLRHVPLETLVQEVRAELAKRGAKAIERVYSNGGVSFTLVPMEMGVTIDASPMRWKYAMAPLLRIVSHGGHRRGSVTRFSSNDVAVVVERAMTKLANRIENEKGYVKRQHEQERLMAENAEKQAAEMSVALPEGMKAERQHGNGNYTVSYSMPVGAMWKARDVRELALFLSKIEVKA